MYKIWGLLISYLFLTNCNQSGKGECYKDLFMEHKFVNAADIHNPHRTISIFSESSQTDWRNDTLLYKSRLLWPSCDNYLIIVEQVPSQPQIFTIGDTIDVRVVSRQKDTFLLKGTFKNTPAELRLVRIE